jgi:serine kinase of HPr protein (carbohydrate metabolism regulator)
MIISDIVDALELEVVAGYNNNNNIEVNGVYIGDLLSIVMANAQAKDIWITIQTHVNIVAVANLVELSGIIIAEGMEIDEETVKKANELNIPIFRSSLTAYQLACKLNELGV